MKQNKKLYSQAEIAKITGLSKATVSRKIKQLKMGLFDYVNWYNTIRPHGALDYLTPKEYKENFYKKCLIFC